ncbi:beta-L-arabinofuranosidase domain-containing protein [Hymenobacter bucti]|uniref:Beta-L-arabinofuranosidase domain-containing protein n=1 Tax=Hymenobacter bucti TaxID=1844114 RepID=A0ABW4R1V1_9BACT
MNMSFSNRNLFLATVVVSLSFTASVAAAQTKLTYAPKAAQLRLPKAQAFSAENVRLLEKGSFKESQDAEARNILSLNPDRLLAPYLKESGLTPKASLYPGWETGVLPGVALEFYLSGVSRLSVATGQKEYASRLSYVLDQLALCQEKVSGSFNN